MRHLLAVLMLTTLWPVPSQEAAPTTIVVVRHAEALRDAGRDPALSPAGEARARALADALGNARVSAVYATQYRRTQLTGAPVARAAGLEVSVRAIDGPLEPYVAALVDHVLRTHAGQTVLIVGHSNTAPAIVGGFSGVDPGEIAHDDHANLFVVTSDGRPGSGRLVRARYGA